MNSGAIEKFIDSIKEPEVETNRTNLAVVSRVDEEGIVWVNLAGAEKETPTASTSAEVKSGDVVNVEWRNNKLYIAGNYTNPSAGITRVVYVERRVSDVNDVANDAVDKAKTAVLQAEEAKSNAQDAVTKANSSVASDTMHYLATSASSGVTINTQGWTTEIQKIDSQKRYLWTYHTYTKAGGAVVNTQPVITGTYGVDGTSVTILGSYDTLAELEAAHPTGQLGDAYMVAGDLYVWNGTAWEDVGQIQGPQGDPGVSIASVTNYYLATSASSGVTRETSGWTTSIQSMTSTKQYLWTYEVVTGSNGTNINVTDPVIIGRYGQNGGTGVGISSVSEHYQVSSSNTIAPTSWSSTPVNMTTTNKYLWNYETITYSNGSTEDTDKRVIGVYGNTGGQGTSVTQIINYYLASPANAGITRESSGWTTAIQTMTSTNQYLWNYEIVKGTGNVTLNTTNPVIIGRYGQNGTNGISITAVQPQYALSTSTSTAPASGWSNTLVYEEGKYIWTRDEITYSNGNVGHSTEIYNSALTSACVNASNALQIAEDTNQYFWHTETGTDTGAHITEIPKEDFIDDPANGGGNLLARSNGIAVRDGLAELAVFGADGSQIGKTGTSHIEMDYRSLRMVDGDTNPHTFFHVSDLRDENNEYQYTDTFTGDGATKRFTLSYSAKRDRELSVTVSDGSGGEPYLDSSISTWLKFETAPSAGAIITATYTTSSYFAKAYTMGMRKANSKVGPLSTCFGLDNIASGDESFAEGWHTKATGSEAHSEGYSTSATGRISHAEGNETTASGVASHAEGSETIASGKYSHAEGEETTASESWSHAEGRGSEASGYYSHAQNCHTIAGHSYQTAIGKYNDNKSGNLFEIGFGSSENNRANALEVDEYGGATLAGYLKIEGHSTQIGFIYSATKSVAISNTNIDNNTDGASINVPAGIYVVIGQWQFNTRTTSGTTNNAVRLYEGSNLIGQVREVAGASNWNSMQCCAIVETVGTSTTLKVCGASSRPYTTAQATQIKAVRIA